MLRSDPPRPRTLVVTLAATLLLSGCALFGHEKPPIDLSTQQPEVLYNHGIDSIHDRSYSQAITQFEAIQQFYPYSPYTANAQLMEGYAYYKRDEFPDAISQLDRFLQLHPTSPDAAYAYYLRALCYYEQIADIQRDQQGTVQAMAALQEVVARFPNTDYARDAALKIDLCRDHLAGKEMLIGRYYERQHFYEAAVNRYQRVVQDFQTTNHVAEALQRLVEVYLKLGLVDQARKTASVLAYNYPGSIWYSYAYDDLRRTHSLEPGDQMPAPKQGGFVSRAWNSVF